MPLGILFELGANRDSAFSFVLHLSSLSLSIPINSVSAMGHFDLLAVLNGFHSGLTGTAIPKANASSCHGDGYLFLDELEMIDWNNWSRRVDEMIRQDDIRIEQLLRERSGSSNGSPTTAIRATPCAYNRGKTVRLRWALSLAAPSTFLADLMLF